MHISQRYSEPRGEDHSGRERKAMRRRRREGSSARVQGRGVARQQDKRLKEIMKKQFNVFSLGAVSGEIKVPTHAQINQSAAGWRKRLRSLNLDGPPKPQKGPRVGKKAEKPVRYAEYIRSSKWRARRIRYYQKFGRKCAACGDGRQLGLHHLSYENLGNEPDGDLVPLCWGCHYRYHEEHGVQRDSKARTYRFINDEQETEELRRLAKNL